MAREPDVALLMTGKLHKKTHLLVFLIIIWGCLWLLWLSQPKRFPTPGLERGLDQGSFSTDVKLGQACPKSGLQAKSGPRSNFVRPAAWFKIMKWIRPAARSCDHWHCIYMKYVCWNICVHNVFGRNSTLFSFFLELPCDRPPQMFISPHMALLAKSLETPEFGCNLYIRQCSEQISTSLCVIVLALQVGGLNNSQGFSLSFVPFALCIVAKLCNTHNWGPSLFLRYLMVYVISKEKMLNEVFAAQIRN